MGELGLLQICALQLCPFKNGTRQVGIPQVRLFQIRVSQISALSPRSAKKMVRVRLENLRKSLALVTNSIRLAQAGTPAEKIKESHSSSPG